MTNSALSGKSGWKEDGRKGWLRREIGGVVEAADDENRRKGSGERREMRQQPSEQEIGPG